ALVAAVALTGNVRIAWSFSAFTVLVYYAITNLAALRLPAEQRRFPRWIPAAGLVGCLTLAFWVGPGVWPAGSALLRLGLGKGGVKRRRPAVSRVALADAPAHVLGGRGEPLTSTALKVRIPHRIP